MQQDEFDNEKEIIFINPYETLGIKKENKLEDFLSKNSRHAYGDRVVTDKYNNLKQINPSNRKKLLLSYYMIFNPEKCDSFNKNFFHIQKKDQFYYVIMDDLENLKKIYSTDKYIFAQKDGYYRNLLHYAVIGEYYDICEFLLKEGINFDEPDFFCATALYHAKGNIKDLLKKYGAKKTVYNTPIYPSINLKYTTKDKIGIIYNNLYSNGFVQQINSIYKNNKIIGKRLIRHNDFHKKDTYNWINSYHGTKFNSISHIMQFGLINYGEPLMGHIGKNETIDDINNWASAIFVTPSILYAKNYSEVISSNGDNWYIIIEAKIEPGYFSTHESTIYNYDYKSGEPHEIEYRIESTDNSENFFFFGGSDQDHIFTTSLLFVQKDFLDNLNNYQEASIFKFSI